MATKSQTSSDLRNIRRMLRVLGALPAHVSNPDATRNAAKLVHDRLRRAGVEPTWYEPDAEAPLIIAGTGPVLVVSYIDDADPGGTEHDGLPPLFDGGIVTAPGILRKAGMIATTVGATHPDNPPGSTTLVIETDRWRGSQTLERWLREQHRTFNAAIWETTDLPIPAPAVIHSAFGQLQVRVTAGAGEGHVPAMYGGVIPDVATNLATAIAALISSDHEVRLEGFYDTVQVPDAEGLALLAELADEVKAGLGHVSPNGSALSNLHLAMGVFFAPSLVVRDIHTHNLDPYLPNAAAATIEIRIVPGQDMDTVLASLEAHFREHLQDVQVTPLLMRPAISGKFDVATLRAGFERVIPASPGPNPAGLIESFDIPTVGFAAVGISAESGTGRAALDDIQSGASVLRELIRHLGTSPPASDQ